MKSYDNTIKYYELLMYYKDTAIYNLMVFILNFIKTGI